MEGRRGILLMGGVMVGVGGVGRGRGCVRRWRRVWLVVVVWIFVLWGFRVRERVREGVGNVGIGQSALPN